MLHTINTSTFDKYSKRLLKQPNCRPQHDEWLRRPHVKVTCIQCRSVLAGNSFHCGPRPICYFDLSVTASVYIIDVYSFKVYVKIACSIKLFWLNQWRSCSNRWFKRKQKTHIFIEQPIKVWQQKDAQLTIFS